MAYCSFLRIFLGSPTGSCSGPPGCLVGSGLGGGGMGSGIWPLVGVLVYVAPIVAFALMLAVLIMSFVRRSRANRGG